MIIVPKKKPNKTKHKKASPSQFIPNPVSSLSNTESLTKLNDGWYQIGSTLFNTHDKNWLCLLIFSGIDITRLADILESIDDQLIQESINEKWPLLLKISPQMLPISHVYAQSKVAQIIVEANEDEKHTSIALATWAQSKIESGFDFLEMINTVGTSALSSCYSLNRLDIAEKLLEFDIDLNAALTISDSDITQLLTTPLAPNTHDYLKAIAKHAKTNPKTARFEAIISNGKLIQEPIVNKQYQIAINGSKKPALLTGYYLNTTKQTYELQFADNSRKSIAVSDIIQNNVNIALLRDNRVYLEGIRLAALFTYGEVAMKLSDQKTLGAIVVDKGYDDKQCFNILRTLISKGYQLNDRESKTQASSLEKIIAMKAMSAKQISDLILCHRENLLGNRKFFFTGSPSDFHLTLFEFILSLCYFDIANQLLLDMSERSDIIQQIESKFLEALPLILLPPESICLSTSLTLGESIGEKIGIIGPVDRFKLLDSTQDLPKSLMIDSCENNSIKVLAAVIRATITKMLLNDLSPDIKPGYLAVQIMAFAVLIRLNLIELANEPSLFTKATALITIHSESLIIQSAQQVFARAILSHNVIVENPDITARLKQIAQSPKVIIKESSEIKESQKMLHAFSLFHRKKLLSPKQLKFRYLALEYRHIACLGLLKNLLRKHLHKPGMSNQIIGTHTVNLDCLLKQSGDRQLDFLIRSINKLLTNLSMKTIHSMEYKAAESDVTFLEKLTDKLCIQQGFKQDKTKLFTEDKRFFVEALLPLIDPNDLTATKYALFQWLERVSTKNESIKILADKINMDRFSIPNQCLIDFAAAVEKNSDSFGLVFLESILSNAVETQAISQDRLLEKLSHEIKWLIGYIDFVNQAQLPAHLDEINHLMQIIDSLPKELHDFERQITFDHMVAKDTFNDPQKQHTAFLFLSDCLAALDTYHASLAAKGSIPG